MLDAPNNIPDVVIKRLPIYSRALVQILATGQRTVSSNELAMATGSTAAQIRRDLSYFGGFGKQGKGYDVERLLAAIREILNLNEQWPVVLIGAGSLGQAVARYGGFAEQGFVVRRVFDHNVERIGMRINDLVVQDVREMAGLVRQEGILVAILAVPAGAAQKVADDLAEAGVKAILNYAPSTIQVPDDVRVHDIDPVAALQSLTYYLSPSEGHARGVSHRVS